MDGDKTIGPLALRRIGERSEECAVSQGICRVACTTSLLNWGQKIEGGPPVLFDAVAMPRRRGRSLDKTSFVGEWLRV
jgi:hypothetical protein